MIQLNPKGRRSSRLLYHAPVNAVPIANTTYYSFRRSPHSEFNIISTEYTVNIHCSGEAEGYEAWRAFTKGQDLNGWLTPVGGVEASWISVNLPGWFYRPKCKTPYPLDYNPETGKVTHYFVHCPAITLLEVWNPSDPNKSVEEFFFQAKYKNQGEEGWVTLKVCKIKDKTANKKTSFPITYYRDEEKEDPYESISNIPEYDEFRIVITKCYGTEQTGFSRIDLCALVDHSELTFGYVTWQEEDYTTYKMPRFYEKFSLEDDYNDGVIWERIHNPKYLYVVTSRWYPGHYAGNSDVTSIVYPTDVPESKDPPEEIQPYVSKALPLGYMGNYQADNFVRSKDFGVRHAYQGCYTTKDGINWSKVQKPTWKQYTSFSIKDNKGLSIGYDDHYAYLLEIDDSGNITSSSVECGDLAFMSTSFYGAIGGIVSCNKWNNPRNEGIPDLKKRYYFMDRFGSIYKSEVTMYYQYYDGQRQEVKTANTNWQYIYLNGKYIVHGRHTSGIYYNEVSKKWETWTKFTVGESDDGFKNITWYDVADPIIGYAEQHMYQYQLFYFNGHYWMSESGHKMVGVNVWDFGSDGYHKTMNDQGFQPTLYTHETLPMVGYRKDPFYNEVTVRYGYNTESGLSGFIIDGGYRVPDPNYALYFKADNGGKRKIVEPYGCIFIKHGFKKHYWSSNSYLSGGIVPVILDGSSLDEQIRVAFIAGDMLCYDNATQHRASEHWRSS